ncbi:hypothetical protein C5Y96_22630 [Blastopirellula marina]|uniref:Uncharacterized protein n=1 Tax=Blastopirellula marina TaxID=124 RepID=A0A2S8F0D1_9BACT|nr:MULTISPECIES: F0F1 ATP synthase subunit delta [Pirellulaceae]PQO25621.1 hypothetical protein C5Y96_22630 [Blastopirellula marina]RCS43304.1 hypothetical protein DTL36_22680 [Bremerella cremea]
MGDSLWTFAFEIVNFLMLAGLLGWFFFKPVRNAIEKERDETRRLEEQSKAKLSQAESIERDLNQQKQTVIEEIEKMRLAATASATQEREQILAKARAEANKELDLLKLKAIHIEQANASRLSQFIVEKTTAIISRLLQDIDGPELESALMGATVRQLEALSAETLSPVSVESAVELDSAAKERICVALKQPAKSVSFRVLPELIGGLRISTAQGLVDASIAGLSRYAKQELLDEVSQSPGHSIA